MFKLFKKKEKVLTDKERVDLLWKLWVKEELPSPVGELLTVISNLGASGHADFFEFCETDKTLANAVEVSFSLLPKLIQKNYAIAKIAYFTTAKEDRGENFLEEYDNVFYDNENLIDGLLLDFAKRFVD